MKILLLTISLMLTSILFSQKITTENKKYLVEGVHVYKHEIKNVLAANPAALNLYNKAKRKETWGGVLIGSGVALCVADAVKAAVSDEKYPSAMTYVGVGLVAVSIPVLSGKNKMRKESIDIYNDGLKPNEKTLGYNFNLNIINNQNGLGFNVTF
uniref:hypothetical protein n=1 Tax=Flavobacterium sp. TaxID=239 RepID=UPI00404AF577